MGKNIARRRLPHLVGYYSVDGRWRHYRAGYNADPPAVYIIL